MSRAARFLFVSRRIAFYIGPSYAAAECPERGSQRVIVVPPADEGLQGSYLVRKLLATFVGRSVGLGRLSSRPVTSER